MKRKPHLREIAASLGDALIAEPDPDFDSNPANAAFRPTRRAPQRRSFNGGINPAVLAELDWEAAGRGLTLAQLLNSRGPSINPRTGAQEFFFDGLRNWFKRNDEEALPVMQMAATATETQTPDSSNEPAHRPKPPFVNPLPGDPPIWREPTDEQLRAMSDDRLASRKKVLDVAETAAQYGAGPLGAALGMYLTPGLYTKPIGGVLGYIGGNLLDDKLDSLSDSYGNEYYRRGYGR